MYASMVCEHMPKTATARNKLKATNSNKGGMLGKKFYFLKKMGRSGDRKQKIFLVRPNQCRGNYPIP